MESSSQDLLSNMGCQSSKLKYDPTLKYAENRYKKSLKQVFLLRNLEG